MVYSEHQKNEAKKLKATLLEEKARRKARESFITFVKFCDPEYIINWHHKRIADELEKFYYSEDQNRLMLFVPPQHGKSQLASRFFPAWVMGKNPDTKIVEASYTIDLSRGFSKDVQRIMRTDEYKSVFPEVGIKDACDTDNWCPLNEEGKETKGYYKAVGVTGGLTGKTVDLGIIDDPVKDAIEANSETYQSRTKDWYDTVFSTRLHNASKQILIMTRWSEADLAGQLLDEDSHKWRVISIPAIKETNDDIDDPREIGEALWPEKHSKERILEFKTNRPKTFTSLYQQRPAPDDGNVIPVNRLKYYKKRNLPDDLRVVLSWDMTFKDEKTSDFVAGHAYGFKDAERYLLDRVHMRADFVKTLKTFVTFYNKWSECVAVLVEDKANGTAILNTLKKKVPRLIPVSPKESKFARAHSAAPSVEAGNLYLPDKTECPWVTEVTEEMRSFPNGKNDDDVDAWSQAENYIHHNFGEFVITDIEGVAIW